MEIDGLSLHSKVPPVLIQTDAAQVHLNNFSHLGPHVPSYYFMNFSQSQPRFQLFSPKYVTHVAPISFLLIWSLG